MWQRHLSLWNSMRDNETNAAPTIRSRISVGSSDLLFVLQTDLGLCRTTVDAGATEAAARRRLVDERSAWIGIFVHGQYLEHMCYLRPIEPK